jgi:hypothetical protein
VYERGPIVSMLIAVNFRERICHAGAANNRLFQRREWGIWARHGSPDIFLYDRKESLRSK